VRGFLRLPFPLFALLSAVIFGAGALVMMFTVSNMTVEMAICWAGFAAIGLLLLARDWAKRVPRE
jgi:hypothetical protein